MLGFHVFFAGVGVDDTGSHIRGLALGVDLQCFCALIIDNGKLGRGICVALGSGNAQETKRFVGKVNLVDS